MDKNNLKRELEASQWEVELLKKKLAKAEENLTTQECMTTDDLPEAKKKRNELGDLGNF